VLSDFKNTSFYGNELEMIWTIIKILSQTTVASSAVLQLTVCSGVKT